MEKKLQDTESRHADKYIVRFPDGMRDHIAEVAKANGRSMNAEIVARLQESFRRDELAEHDPATYLSLLKGVVEKGEPKESTERLYILLDSHGYPQSWAEIHEYLRALRQAGGFNPVEVEAHIITPDMESSSRRSREAAALAKRLRAEGKSRPITGDES